MKMPNRPRTGERGQSLVEFAFVLLPLILFLVGIFDLGRGVFSYNTIANAAREGARFAIVDQTSDTTCAAPEASAQCVAAAHAAALDIDPADVDVAYPDGCTAAGCSVEVTVQYVYTAATPLVGNVVGPITMQAASRLEIEHASGP